MQILFGYAGKFMDKSTIVNEVFQVHFTVFHVNIMNRRPGTVEWTSSRDIYDVLISACH
jgi:hypothetical protein